MFDIHYNGPRAMSVTEHREIHEHRAPTDESVRLLREMEMKAQDNILLAIQCNTTGFSYKAMVYYNFNLSQRMRIQFTLGDEQHDIDVDVPRLISMTANPSEDYLLSIRDCVAKRIAGVLVLRLTQDKVLFSRV